MKKLLSLVLAVSMCVSMLPMTVFAHDAEAVGDDYEETNLMIGEVNETEVSFKPDEATVLPQEEVVEIDEDSAFSKEEAVQPNADPVLPEEKGNESDDESKEENVLNVDIMTDAELLNYYAALSDDEVDEFALSLTEDQLSRLAELLEGVELCDESSETHTVFKNIANTLAPGVDQNIKYAYSKDGKQMVYYVATADVTRDDVIVQTSYKNQYMNKEFGMQKLTDQIAYANELYTDNNSERYISDYYNVVAGVNASFYNMTTGQPSGITYLDGIQIGESSSYKQFFAILTNGKAIVEYTKNISKYVDEDGNSTIWQAVAGSEMLVWDGVDVTANVSGSYNTDRHSRTCVGVTEDGKVVMMVLDGRQEPFSCGGTMHELAQIMIEAGCISAINLDGGGSTTYVSKAEGEDNVSLVNRPSDGSERTISSGLIIASLSVPSDTFDHVSMTVTDEYVTPGTSTTVKVTGVSAVGSAATLPDNITYEVVNGTYANGVLTAMDVGDVVLTAKVNGNAVGSVTIHAVIPTAIEFNAEKRTISYGKTVEFDIAATINDGLYPVKYKAGDIVLSMSNADFGTIKGLSFTATEEAFGIVDGVITAKLIADESVSDTIAITLTNLPDEPVIYEDFEDSPEYKFEYSEWYYTAFGEYKIVDSTIGKVHSGDNALAVTVALRGSSLNGYHGGIHIGAKTNIYDDTGKYDKITGTKTFEDLDLTNAKSLGMWIYIPEDSPIFYVQFRLRNKDNYASQLQYRLYDYGYSTTERGHTGWQYFELDFDKENTADVQFNDGSFYLERIDLYACTRNDGVTNENSNQKKYGYNRDDQQSVQGPITFYFDDITVEYVDNGMDNVDPTFDYVRATYSSMSDGVTLEGQTINSNVVSVTARASDVGVGIDSTSAKAYIDGIEVTSGFHCDDLGIMTIDDVTLADGTHTFTFVISDKNGNCEYVTRQLTVDANSDIPTASLKLAEELTSKPLFGQVIWMNLEVDKIENVNKISTLLNLNSESTWELENMVVADGFEASYIIDSITNDATITITQTGKTELSGHNVVVQIPVRMYYAAPLVDSTNDSLSSQTLPPEDIKLSMDMGLVSYKDGTNSTFSMIKFDIDSERYSWYDVMNKNGDIVAGYVAHIHTAEAIDDEIATCTEAGYKNRTYCETCKSVVDWGNTISATGHNYLLVNGVVKCNNDNCNVLFTGTWTDGKEYKDGVLIMDKDGWKGDSYYKDGKKLTGVHKVPASDASGEFYYDFGTDGISTGKFTGLFAENGCWYYSINGQLKSGWYLVDDDYYYFNSSSYAAVTGECTLMVDKPVTYSFDEKGRLTTGVWDGNRYYYGPAYYWRGWKTIDKNTYYFDNGYCKIGKSFVVESNSTIAQWYEFDTNGAMVKKITDTGLYWFDDNLYYIVDGQSQMGMYLIDGSYYYFLSGSRAAVVNASYNCTNLNGCALSVGTYEFGIDGKMINTPKDGIVTENGTMYYYVNGTKNYAGLINIDGDYYYVNSSCKVVTGAYNVWKTNNLLPRAVYTFGEDGKMHNPPTLDAEGNLQNGIVTEDGTMYYYKDGVKNYAGLINIDGDYYYVNSSCKVVTGTYYIWKTNNLLERANYKFDADGKMIMDID